MDKPLFFEQITVEIPVKEIYSRLGYRQGLTQVSAQQKKEIDASINEAAGCLKLKGSGRRMAIKSKSESALELSGGISFASKLVASTFKDCQELLFMGATAGGEIIKAIRNLQKADLSKGVIFDAVASETVDSCFDWMRDYFAAELKREGKHLMRKRISCGYGDFLLTQQKIIFALLELDKIGVSLNDKYILIPEKSVTALTGVV